MSEQANVGAVPTWDITDRLVKSLRVSGMGHQAMADYLGVSRNTIGNYTGGRTNPDKRTLMLWALRTGVPFEWLVDGEEGPRPGGPDGGIEAGGKVVGVETVEYPGSIRLLRTAPLERTAA